MESVYSTVESQSNSSSANMKNGQSCVVIVIENTITVINYKLL